jgi:hypothetical protein
VPGGVGGGLDFNYQAGNVTFEPPATANGMAFEFWYVALPSQTEQVTSNHFIISLPAGYVPVNSLVEAS